MSKTYITDALCVHLKARNITYKELADAIGLSEISVERLFTGVPYLSYALAVRKFADNPEQAMGTILLSSLRVANEDYMRSAA